MRTGSIRIVGQYFKSGVNRADTDPLATTLYDLRLTFR